MKHRSLNIKLPRPVVFLSLVSLLTDIAGEAIYPVLPLFLTTTLGASVVFVGALEGIAETVASITKFFSGYASDRLGRREPFVLAGYSLAALSRAALSVVATPWQALVCRFFDRFGKGVRGAPRDAWLSSLATPSNRGWVFGFHRAMDHLGATLGPIGATVFLYYFPQQYRRLFFLTFFPGVLAVLLVLAARRSSPEAKRALKSKPAPWRQALAISPSLRAYFVILLIFTLGNSSDAFLILRLKNAGVPAAFIPALWAALHWVKMSASLYGGKCSDRFGRKTSIALGWLLYAAVYFALGFAKSKGLVVAAFLIYGVYFGLTEAPEKALIADLTTESKQGAAYGIYNLVLGIGALPASLIFGYLWNAFGPQAAFSAGAALALAACLCLSALRFEPQRG